MPLPYLVVFLGVLSVSSASILFRYTTAAPIVVAFYRLAFSVMLLGGPLLYQKRERNTSRDWGLSALSGLFLAVHFATWFFSLRLTSIASSTVLVSTHPFILLLYGCFLRHEKPQPKALIGIFLAVCGTGLVGWGDFAIGRMALLGDILALLGAISVSGYLLIGREIRQRMSALRYSAAAYSSAALTLLLLTVLSRSALTGFSQRNWPIFLALAVFPTILGHTLFNWALRYLPPPVVSVTILGEPVGATIIAWLIWRDTPTTISTIGSSLILVGIGIYLNLNKPA